MDKVTGDGQQRPTPWQTGCQHGCGEEREEERLTEVGETRRGVGHIYEPPISIKNSKIFLK